MACKTWALTINNWTVEEYEGVRNFGTDKCTRLACGREIGEEGTPHLQIFLTTKKATTLGKLKEVFPRAHIERGVCHKGDKGFDYCFKEDDEPIEIDNRAQGARTDIHSLYEKLKTGATMSDVMDLEPTLQHIQIAEKWQKYKAVKRPNGPRTVLWYWGPTGTGKTRAAYEIDPDLLAIQPVTHTAPVWFDGYIAQKTVLLDDLRPSAIAYAKLLRLLDRYTLQEQVKGGMVWANYDTIIVTSALGPHEWPTDDTGVEQLLRRIVTVKKFTEVA